MFCHVLFTASVNESCGKLLMNNLQISPLYIKAVRAASHDAALT